MSTEYLSLNDSRPELINGFSTINSNKPIPKISKNTISINENKFMNMSLNQIFDKIINIFPNIYNDYYTKSLQTKIRLKNTHDDDITDSDLFRETMRSFIFENENIIYLGILILIISIFLYIIN